MPAPVFQAVGTQFAATNATTATWPTHQTNDIGLLVIETDGLATDITISGWNGWINAVDSGTGSKLQVLWKRAASSAEPSVTIPDSGDHQIGAIFTFRGCRVSGSPVFGTQVSTAVLSNGGSVTWPSLSVTEDNTLVLLIATRANDNASTTFFGVAQPGAGANLTGVAEAGEIGSQVGNGGGATVQYGTLAIAGSSGSYTSTVTTTGVAHQLVVAALLGPIAISGAKGSFTVTGNDVTFRKAYRLASSNGIFTISGNSANLKKGAAGISANGSFLVTGRNAFFIRSYSLISNKGSVSINGNPVAVRTLRAKVGNFSVSGNIANFNRSRIFLANYGSFAVFGINVSFGKGRILAVEPAQYSVTGKNAYLIRTIDPQQNLNDNFPDATEGDAVVDQNTGDVWIYNGTTWLNAGSLPGETIQVSGLIPVVNETLYSTCITTTGISVKSLPYSLELEIKIVDLPSIAIGINANILNAVYTPPNSGKVLLSAYEPSVRKGVAVFGSLYIVLINNFVPSISASSGIGIPSSNILISGIAPSIASLTKTITIPNSIALILSSSAPSLINISDPYWSNVVLLLKTEGYSFGKAPTGRYFADAGPSALTIRTTAKDSLGYTGMNVIYSNTRVKYGANSALFSDDTSLLKIEANSSTVIGLNPFTVELWLYLTSLSSVDQFILGDTNLTDGGELVIYFNNTFFGVKKADTQEGYTSSHGGLLTTGAWHHIAVTRDSSFNSSVFINGSKLNTTQLLSDFSSASSNQGKLIIIGGNGTSGGTLRGFVEDLRITKQARYVNNFTVPSEEFEGNSITPISSEPNPIPFSAVKLLIHGTGSITDSSSTGTTITPTSVSINTTVLDPFGLQSGVLSFNGAASYLSLGSNAGLIFGTDPFCLEFWVYLTAAYDASTFVPFGNDTSVDAIPNTRLFCQSGGYGTEILFDILKTSICPTILNTWHHVAFTRDSLGEGRVFIDGKMIEYPEFLANYLSGYYWTGNGKKSFDTQINRINKRADGDPYYDNVVLRVNFDAYLDGIFFIDEATPASSVQWTYQFGYGSISTNDKKYGQGSYFNDYLTLAGARVSQSAYFNSNQQRFNLGVQYGGEPVVKPTTIEAFIKPTANPIADGQWLEYCVVGRASDYNLHVYPTANGANSYISVWNDASFFYTGGASPGPAEIKIYPPAPGIVIGQWHHVAITTDSYGNMFFWLNGAQVGWAVKSWGAGTGDQSSLAPLIEIGSIRRQSVGTPLNCFRGYIDGVRITNGKIISGVGWTPGVTRYVGVVGQQTGGTYTVPSYDNMYSNLSGSNPGLYGYMCEIRATKGYARYLEDFEVPNGRFSDTEKLGVMVLQTAKIGLKGIVPDLVGSRPSIGSIQHYQSLNGESINMTWPADATTNDVGLIVVSLEGTADSVPEKPTTTYPVWNSALANGKFATSTLTNVTNGADSDSSIVAAWWTKLTGGYPTSNPTVTIPGPPTTARRVPASSGSIAFGGGTLGSFGDLANLSNTTSFATGPNNTARDVGGTLLKVPVLTGTEWYDALPANATATFTMKYALCDADGSTNSGFVEGPIAPINTGNNISFNVKIGVYDSSTGTLVSVFTGPTLTTTLTLSLTTVSYTINTSLLVPYASSRYDLALWATAQASGGSPNNRRSLAVFYLAAEWPLSITKMASSFVVIKNTSSHPSAAPFVLQTGDTLTSITARSGSQRICPTYNLVSTPTTTCQSSESFSEQIGCINLACFITPLSPTSDIFSNNASCSSLTEITKGQVGGVSDATSNLGSTIQFVYGKANKYGTLAPISISKSASTKYIALSWVFENSNNDAYTNYIYARISGADGEPLNEAYWSKYKAFILNLHPYNACSLLYNFGGAKYYTSCMFATTCPVIIISGVYYYINNSNQTYYTSTDLYPFNIVNSQYSRTTGLRGSPTNGSYVQMPSTGAHWWLITDTTPSTSITTYTRRGEIVYGNSPSGYAHSEWAIEQDDLGWSYTPWDYNATTEGIDGYRYNDYGVAGPGTEFVGFAGAYFQSYYYWWIENTFNQLLSSGLSSGMDSNPYLFASPGLSGMTNFSNAKVFCGVHLRISNSSGVSTIKSFMESFYNDVKNLQL